MSSSPPTHFRPYLLVTLVGGAVVALDLTSKYVVREFPPARELGFVELVHNPSYSLGIGGQAGIVLPVLSAVALILAVCWLGPRLRDGRIRPAPAGLLLGGGLANLIDRVLHGAVTDFLVTPILILNLADLAVLTGMVGFVVTGGYGHLTVGLRHRGGADLISPPRG